MSIIKKLFLKTLILTVFIISSVQSEDLTKLGTFKDWNAVAVFNETGKICFAYSIPVSESPKASNREARLFVSFRPEDKISDEVSITSGYDFNPQNAILATSGKSKFEFDLPQNKFAWISSGKTEQKIIKRMKKASRLMITAYKQSGTRTTDDYSLMGFTKAYNAAKKSCT